MSNPRPVAFPLLKLGLPGRGPCNKWFADGGKMHHVHDARRSNDASLDVSPRFPSTGPQTFAANIAFVGFGGSCLGNRHEAKIPRCYAKRLGCSQAIGLAKFQRVLASSGELSLLSPL